MIDVKEDNFYIAMFFIEVADMNIMGCAWHDTEAQLYKIVFRERMYNEDSENPFDGKDEKTFYEFLSKEETPLTEKGTNKTLKQIKTIYDTSVKLLKNQYPYLDTCFDELNCDGNKFIEYLKKKKFVNVKELSDEEANELGIPIKTSGLGIATCGHEKKEKK